MVWERSPHTNLKRNLTELIFELNMSRIAFLGSDGEPLISPEEIVSGRGPHIFQGMKPEEIRKIRANLKKEQTRHLLSNLYGDKDGNTFRSVFLPIESHPKAF